MAQAEQSEGADAAAVGAPVAEMDTSKGPIITGLTGELAMQKMGKSARKKLLEEQRKEEMER